MAFTTIIIISLFAAVQAGFAHNDYERRNAYHQMPHIFHPTPLYMRMPTPPTPPTLPSWFGGHMIMPAVPFLPFPPSMIQVPTPEDIENMQPGPNQDIIGSASRAHIESSRDKDGNVVRTQGTTTVTNINGKVQKTQVGDNPPNIYEPVVIPPFHSDFDTEIPDYEPVKFHKFGFDFPKVPDFEPIVMPDFEPIVMPKFKPIKMPKFKPIKMPKFEPMEPIDPEKIRNRVPNKGETFVTTASTSYSSSSNIDGKVSSTIGGTSMVNDNGKVDEKSVHASTADKDPSKKKSHGDKTAKKNKKQGDSSPEE